MIRFGGRVINVINCGPDAAKDKYSVILRQNLVEYLG